VLAEELSDRVLTDRGCAPRLDADVATRSPLGVPRDAAFGHRCVGGTGTGQRRAGHRPFAHLACAPGREARRSRGPFPSGGYAPPVHQWRYPL